MQTTSRLVRSTVNVKYHTFETWLMTECLRFLALSCVDDIEI